MGVAVAFESCMMNPIRDLREVKDPNLIREVHAPMNELVKDMNLDSEWRAICGIGIVLTMIGIFSIVYPIASSYSLSLVLAIVMVVSGMIQIFHSFRSSPVVGRLSQFFLGALSIAVGIVAFRTPLIGVIGLTLVLMTYLIMSAVGKWILAAELRPRKGWAGVAASAVISFLLFAFLLVTFPVSAFWVPGVFFGVDLISYGAALIGFSMMLRHAVRDLKGQFEEEKVGKVA